MWVGGSQGLGTEEGSGVGGGGGGVEIEKRRTSLTKMYEKYTG